MEIRTSKPQSEEVLELAAISGLRWKFANAIAKIGQFRSTRFLNDKVLVEHNLNDIVDESSEGLHVLLVCRALSRQNFTPTPDVFKSNL